MIEKITNTCIGYKQCFYVAFTNNWTTWSTMNVRGIFYKNIRTRQEILWWDSKFNRSSYFSYYFPDRKQPDMTKLYWDLILLIVDKWEYAIVYFHLLSAPKSSQHHDDYDELGQPRITQRVECCHRTISNMMTHTDLTKQVFSVILIYYFVN